MEKFTKYDVRHIFYLFDANEVCRKIRAELKKQIKECEFAADNADYILCSICDNDTFFHNDDYEAIEVEMDERYTIDDVVKSINKRMEEFINKVVDSERLAKI